jgi:hypothetical protein
MVRGLQLWLRSLPNGLHSVREGQDDRSQPSISNVDSPVFHLFDLSMLIDARHSQVHVPETAPNYDSGYFRKQIFQAHENRPRKPQRPFRRFLDGCNVDRNSITVWEGIGNNLKSFAIHVNVVGRTVAEVLNSDAVVSNGFVDRMIHDSAYFL